MRVWIAFAFLTVASAAPASADIAWYTYQQRQIQCDSPGMYDAEVSIQGCTAIIRGRSATAHERAAAYRNRGDRYRSINNYDAAFADYGEAIRIDASSPLGFYRRGEIYLRRGQFEPAVADFTRVITLQAERDYGFAARCEARALDNMNGARADCDQALTLRSDSAQALSGRAVLNMREGTFEAAWQDFNAASASDPAVARYLYGRGLAALRLGRAAEGQADLAAAAQRDNSVVALFAGAGLSP
jgi:lipoprotein NlpI